MSQKIVDNCLKLLYIVFISQACVAPSSAAEKLTAAEIRKLLIGTYHVSVADSVTAPVKYAYVADLGGNVYRISGATANTPIGTTAPASWTITKIAALGGTGVATFVSGQSQWTHFTDQLTQSAIGNLDAVIWMQVSIPKWCD